MTLRVIVILTMSIIMIYKIATTTLIISEKIIWTGRRDLMAQPKKNGTEIKLAGKHQNGKSVNENHVNNGKPIKIKWKGRKSGS